MSMQHYIETTIKDALKTDVVEVVNESHMHSGPATESHFKVTVVSPDFEGKMLIQRHRAINALLNDELSSGKIHALALHTMTPDEYFRKAGVVPDSPQCMGGSK